jgi:hypothetical protein
VAAAYAGLGAVARSATLGGDNALYAGRGTPGAPLPGDVRVSFAAAAPATASVLARLERGGRLAPYHVAATGRDLLLAYEGELTPGAMLARAAGEHAVVAWACRAGGWAMAVAGLALMLQPAALAPAWIPVVGGALSGVVGCGVVLLAVGVGTATAGATIAIAWFAVRPALSLALLAACAAVLAGTRWAAARGGGSVARGRGKVE